MLKACMSVEHNFSEKELNQFLQSPSIDHDGTIADSRKIVTEEFNKRYNTNYKVIELNHWNAIIDWCKQIGMSDKDAKIENEDLWYKPETLFKAEPVSGAIEFLHELYMRNKKFIINSSRIPKLRESTIEWYKIHAPFVNTDNIKTGIDGFEGIATKVNRINAIRRKLHIDDSPEHTMAVLKYTRACVILLSNSNFDTKDLRPEELRRLFQVKGKDGEMPDFWPVNNIFFG